MLVRGKFSFLYVDIWFDMIKSKVTVKNISFKMLVVFLPIFVVDTKITFVYNFVAPLIQTKWRRKWKISNMLLVRRTLCFSSYESRRLKVKLLWIGAREKKGDIFCTVYFVQRKFFNIFFISMYRVWNKLSEYIDFYISKSITSYAFAHF